MVHRHPARGPSRLVSGATWRAATCQPCTTFLAGIGHSGSDTDRHRAAHREMKVTARSRVASGPAEVPCGTMATRRPRSTRTTAPSVHGRGGLLCVHGSPQDLHSRDARHHQSCLRALTCRISSGAKPSVCATFQPAPAASRACPPHQPRPQCDGTGTRVAGFQWPPPGRESRTPPAARPHRPVRQGIGGTRT